MTKKRSNPKEASSGGLILLGIMGITGLILIVFGIIAIFEISPRLGLILVVLGILTYVAFVLIEKKFKIL
jgi:FtsH-binding integral membrane protein